ncbi:putative transcription factor IIA, alpha/beta subunit, transcription factor IIA, helical [Lupinus albus]|uniref:Putative transcription factor IIA, alpha/beta subunit, transcription factor IIA, helical n=1 Tax=Lupinus albus TaxID=3870 RepID=A0A6A4R0A6_LUPAL|nr:putative transcription factor IIA, alpha/beta subunit, transcription factor IIA, helical [Lupinus albus]
MKPFSAAKMRITDTWSEYTYNRMQTYLYSILYSLFLVRSLLIFSLFSLQTLSNPKLHPLNFPSISFSQLSLLFFSPETLSNRTIYVMAASPTSQVYIQVIDDVINKVRDEFVNNQVLKELQAMWESKMIQAGVFIGPIERSSAPKPTPGGPITPVHDLNMPYEGTEEYETPTAEILFPPTPVQTPMQTPLPGTVDNSIYNIPTGPTDYTSPGNGPGGNTEMKGGRPSPYMQPPSPWMNQRPALDVNVAYVEGRDEADRGTSNQPLTQDFFTLNSAKRKRDEFASQYNAGGYIPQQDGAGDVASGVFEIELYGGSIPIDVGHSTEGKISGNLERQASRIPQLDGPIPYEDDVLSTPNVYNYGGAYNEDYNIANTPAPPEAPVSTPALIAQLEVEEEEDDDEPPLNEDDDDDLDDLEQGDEQNTHHLVLAQFDKVSRTKSRWKCTLKDGIMHINNKDILFNKATGEFDF